MAQGDELAPKQLKMSIGAAAVRRLQPVSLPSGYYLRIPRDDDGAGWIKLLDVAGFEGWDQAQFDTYMQEPERREGSYLVEWEGEPVAATFASRRREQPPEGALDYVVCHPDHRNRKLGHAVCSAVLVYLIGRGYETVSLATDDWRLPAVKLYLNLGFRPLLGRVDMPLRWEAIYRQLYGKGPFAA